LASNSSENKKAELPHSKAARLSVETRSFPSLPLGRFGFVSCQSNYSFGLLYFISRPDSESRQQRGTSGNILSKMPESIAMKGFLQ